MQRAMATLRNAGGAGHAGLAWSGSHDALRATATQLHCLGGGVPWTRGATATQLHCLGGGVPWQGVRGAKGGALAFKQMLS